MQLRAVKGLCSSVAWVHFSRVACALLVQLRTKNLPKDRLIRGGTVVPGRFVMSDSVTQYNSRLYTECIWVYALFMLFSDPWNFRESRCWLKKRPWCCAAWLLAISRTSSLSSKWLAADLKLWKAGQFVTPAQHELTLVCPNRTGTERNAYRNTPFAQKNGAKGGVQLAILATKPLLSWKPWWPVRQRLTSSPSFRPSTAGWPLHSPWRPSFKEFQIAAGRASKATGGAATLAPLHSKLTDMRWYACQPSSYTWGGLTWPQVIGDQAPYTAGPGTPGGAFRQGGVTWRSCCT